MRASVADSNDLIVTRAGGVASITFNRPARLNAFARATYEELHAILGDVARDEAIRAVVLTGNGRGFCAGEDLQELDAAARSPDFAAYVESGIAVLQDITRRIVESDAVFIAAVNGVAAGFGAELSIACDLRVVARSARFLFPEVRRWLFITNGVSFLLPRLVGRGRAAELLLTGEPIGAEEAHRIGLANHLVPDEGCVHEALRIAEAVASNAAMSVARTKRIIRETADGGIEDALAREVAYAMECFRGGAHEEGARAFLEKRAAKFEAPRPEGT